MAGWLAPASERQSFGVAGLRMYSSCAVSPVAYLPVGSLSDRRPFLAAFRLLAGCATGPLGFIRGAQRPV